MDLLRHLGNFLVVAEELHFGRAAARLHISQPPLSQSIQRLERELGVELFDRSGRQVALTDGGRLLLTQAREVLAGADRLHALAARLRRGEAGTLRAGVPPDLGGKAVAALVTAFRARGCGVELKLREIGTAEQLRALADRGLDVGVLRHPFDTSWLGLGPVLTSPLGVLLPADSPLTGHDAVRLGDLDGLALVLFPRATAPALHDEVLTTCARHGYAPTEVHQAANPDFALGLVLAGGCVALHDGVDPPGDAVWRPLRGRPLAWRTSSAWPRGRQTPATRAFADAVEEVLRAKGMSPAEGTLPRFPRPAAEYLA
ncbi:LysR family transcriptional regulator [Umezawaea tangerina]|uniref:DNA-binding transcriptional LysR family regulator n=1 Tax=Umezawaea tangerina TaxID=84725 RepID=A0A2T0TAA4_9PSEU|nr:LysR substrate-binding domain-containing protein [Umezawaea tangerina]PRY42602.1 DNA-binding transcriptional LysR family regulator [Umezawaea tangerina]